MLDFPGGPMIKNPSANAGDMGVIPGPGRVHMLWALGPCAAGACSKTLEQQLLSPCTTTTGVCALKQEVITENSPCSLQLEKACSQQ